MSYNKVCLKVGLHEKLGDENLLVANKVNNGKSSSLLRRHDRFALGVIAHSATMQKTKHHKLLGASETTIGSCV